ncbi:MAG: hypothetical protein JW734_07170 [Candidatus Omnitrophica bacterium]|nr:hypothetical protein [Candidatus Omnitrophota bacterium]
MLKKDKFISIILFVYLGIFAADIILRFPLCSWPYFRAWEYIRQYPAYGAAFIPNKTFKRKRIWGNLSNQLRENKYKDYRQQEFSSDKYGFRNSNDIYKNKDIPVFIFGDSFMAGAALDDKDTLSCRLSQRLNLPVYNAALGNIDDFLTGYFPVNLPKPKVIILSALETQERSVSEKLKRKFTRKNEPEISVFFRVFGKKFEHNKDNIERWLKNPSLKRWFIRFKKDYLEDYLGDLWFKPPEIKMSVETLKNYQPMLFLKSTAQIPEIKDLERQKNGFIEYFQALDEKCKEENITLVALFIPNKYTVYHPLLKSRPDPEIKRREEYLLSMEDEFKNKAIQVVNLLEPFKKEAARLIEEDEYIYLQDDTHWNAKGIEIAAEEITKCLTKILKP